MIAFNSPRRESDAAHPIYEPGQLVKHRRYGYRGVVVHRDEQCMADESWYAKNQTQPGRDQPWYHVLVDGAVNCTYAASENLLPDPEGIPIEHPLVAHFFVGFQDGMYVRNDEPWPGWE